MTPLSTASAIADLDPLIVTSPVIRSGTTLLQRLLCSSPDTVIYGELCGQDLEFLLQLYMMKIQLYSAKASFYAENLRHVLDGRTNAWIPDLMPDLEAYVAAFGNGAFAALANCRDHAASVGRNVWGFKYPGWQPAMLMLLQRHLPRSRYLCIHRDLLACARSAKAQDELRSTHEFASFCTQWSTNLRYMLSRQADPNYLVLSYDELIAAQQQTVARIQSFTGSTAIDMRVFQHKINGFASNSTAHQDAQDYTPPATLSDEELDLVHRTRAAFDAQTTAASR